MVFIQKIIRFAINSPAHYKQTTRKVNSLSLGSSVNLSLSIEDEKAEYTSGDVINGEVSLELTQEIDVSEISIKYKVEESTMLHGTVPQPTPLLNATDNPSTSGYYNRKVLRDRQRYERKLLRVQQRQQRSNQHAHMSDARICSQKHRVFPSPQESEHIQAKKLTLAPGTHRFNFSIRVPGHQGDGYRVLPPSFDDSNGNSIVHALKATVKRSSNIKHNSRAEIPINFVPSRRAVAGSDSFQTVSRSFQLNETSSSVVLTAEVPRLMEKGSSSPINLGLSTDDNAPVIVDSVSLKLLEKISIKAGTRMNTVQKSVADFNSSPLGISGSFLDLSPYLQQANNFQSLTPSFQSKYITVSYRLGLIVRIHREGGASQTISLEHTVPVTGSVMAGDDYSSLPGDLAASDVKSSHVSQSYPLEKQDPFSDSSEYSHPPRE